MEERYQRSAQAVRGRKREKKLQDTRGNFPKRTEFRNSAIPLNGENGQGCSSVANEQGFTSQSGDKTFDIQIPEFSLEAIITGSSKVTSQDIVDLFNVAMKVRRKEVLCWYCYYKVYEDRIRDVKSISNIDDQSARTLVYNEIKAFLHDLHHFKYIGSGRFVSVYVARWKNMPTKYAIKKFIDNKEVYLTKMVNSHANIIQFHGVTKIEDEERYLLVLDYAEGGTLRDYLRNNIIEWKTQIRFARDYKCDFMVARL
ncbi:unnamed protein product [Rhizophagus irregularis]|nr:unnamed protein product [Rhizophagus irregularis]